MIISMNINNQIYKIDETIPLDISIPLEFNSAQPNIYGVGKATAEAYEDEHFVGDTRRGGSCNFENIKLNPHCNGTHTECVGHLTNERISVQDCLQDAFMLANLITVAPENAMQITDTYSVKLNENDYLITKRGLQNSLANQKSKIKNQKSLIIRTLPNDDSKKSRDYSQNPPPFFSIEAMEFIVELGIKHLLVDIPSLDRLHDEGKLFTHRIFWNVEPGSFELNAQSRINNTVTEMIYVSNEIKDGLYLLNLQIAPFVADASPSRPLIFEIVSNNLDNLAF